jgi:hypothetical protein
MAAADFSLQQYPKQGGNFEAEYSHNIESQLYQI